VADAAVELAEEAPDERVEVDDEESVSVASVAVAEELPVVDAEPEEEEVETVALEVLELEL
jgi:hypothetical protein